MKTTVEIPDALFRQAKATAASRGQTLKALLTDALQSHLARSAGAPATSEPPAMVSFGALRDLHDETVRIQALIDEEFGKIEEEDRK